jgi:signal transduction histidine kinase
LYTHTRAEERFQLDEWPIGLGALLAGLAWFAWRRYREALAEARPRMAAETRLAQLIRENWELTQQNLRIHEAKRKHLARELHDELGQYLNAIKLDAVTQDAPAIVASVDHLHQVVRDMIATLRPWVWTSWGWLRRSSTAWTSGVRGCPTRGSR